MEALGDVMERWSPALEIGDTGPRAPSAAAVPVRGGGKVEWECVQMVEMGMYAGFLCEQKEQELCFAALTWLWLGTEGSVDLLLWVVAAASAQG